MLKLENDAPRTKVLLANSSKVTSNKLVLHAMLVKKLGYRFGILFYFYKRLTFVCSRLL